MKTCTQCKESKPYDQFYRRSRAPDGHEAWCKPCRLAHNRRWWGKNHERHRSLTKKYHQENKDKVRQKFKERYEKNKSDYLAKYYERDERTKRSTPAWFDRELVRSTYWMARFLSFAVGRQYHVDHIVPLKSKKVCGLHVQGNLSIVPAEENWSKFNTVWPDMA